MVNLQSVPGVILIFVVLAVILGIAAEISDTLGSEMTLNSETYTSNTTFTIANDTATAVTGYYILKDSLRVYNGTGNILVPEEANHGWQLTDPPLGGSSLITLRNQTLGNSSTEWRLNFDFYSYSTAFSSAENTTESLGEVSSWLPLIGLIIAAAVIIGLVIGAFGAFGGRGDTGFM